MDREQFKKRTKQLAVRVIRMSGALPKTWAAEVVGKQIIRSSSSVGANYRAACRAKSTADMINKLKIVEEEADETLFWLEVLVEADIMPEARLANLYQETDEILAMTAASLKTFAAARRKASITNRQSYVTT